VRKSGKQRSYRCVFSGFWRKKREGRRLRRPGNPPPPRVFCEKSSDITDSKGVDFFGVDKEFITV